MEETVTGIREYRGLNPGLVSPRTDGDYEVVVGHRRKRGSELVGKTATPVIVRNYTDDEAAVIMVDSNTQRENILPSEKAFAYKMKLDTLKHQGTRSSQGEETADMVGKEAGHSGKDGATIHSIDGAFAGTLGTGRQRKNQVYPGSGIIPFD